MDFVQDGVFAVDFVQAGVFAVNFVQDGVFVVNFVQGVFVDFVQDGVFVDFVFNCPRLVAQGQKWQPAVKAQEGLLVVRLRFWSWLKICSWSCVCVSSLELDKINRCGEERSWKGSAIWRVKRNIK